MMHAERCPVCEGSGQVDAGRSTPATDLVKAKQLLSPCHGCDGKGWVALEDSHGGTPDDIDEYPEADDSYAFLPDGASLVFDSSGHLVETPQDSGDLRQVRRRPVEPKASVSVSVGTGAAAVCPEPTDNAP